jgi:hypothetical protein
MACLWPARRHKASTCWFRQRQPAAGELGEAARLEQHRPSESGDHHRADTAGVPRSAGKEIDTRSMVICMATKKVTVTIPEDLLDEIRAEAAERGLSAYVAEALRFKRDRDRLQELVDWLEEEHGPVTEDERTAALEELDDLDAEHDRRRAARKSRAGEAA